MVVLDEADEMLDMGFAEDLEAILEATPDDAADGALLRDDAAAQSPTSPTSISRIRCSSASRARSFPPGSAPRVRQVAYIVGRAPQGRHARRACSTWRIPTSAIVFCRTRTEVDELTETLDGRGYRAEALHGGLSQEQRDRVMKRFRDNTSELLVATDVAARGLDIEHVSHVVNFDVPSSRRGVRAPHRAHGPRRPRGRRDRCPKPARIQMCEELEHRHGGFVNFLEILAARIVGAFAIGISEDPENGQLD